MYCFNCGEKVSESFNVCPVCGMRLKKNVAKIDPIVDPGPISDTDTIPDTEADLLSDIGNAQDDTDAAALEKSSPDSLSMMITWIPGSKWNPTPIANAGKITVTPTGIFFKNNALTGYSGDHSYTLDEIDSTEFKITHIFVVPARGYIVTLKNGDVYTYTFSPFQAKAINRIDRFINKHRGSRVPDPIPVPDPILDPDNDLDRVINVILQTD